MDCAALVLAAGSASRWGRPKQLLVLDGETLVDRAARRALAAGCDPVVRVLGAHATEISLLPCPAGVTTVVNAHWADGMGTSLALGVREIVRLRPDCAALVVLLCDQPLVTPELLVTMVENLAASGRSIALCDHGEGTRGPPALFTRRHFPALQALTGDQGARHLARALPGEALAVPFPGGRWDLDTPEEYERFLRRNEGRPSGREPARS